MTAESKHDTVRLQEMSRAFVTSAALYSAIDIGLFTAIARGANTSATVAARTDISELNAARIMTMCAAAGLLEWRDGKYANAPDVQRYLVEGESRYAGAWLQYFQRLNWEKTGRLTEFLRTQEPAQLTPEAHAGLSVEEARRYHEATASIGFGAGRRFARDVDLSKRTKLLDLGGGSGAYSIVATERNEGLRAVVLDLPPIVEVTREFIAKHGATDRVEAVAGDFTRDEFPAGCDVAVMASNMPIYGPEAIQSVITKAFAALEPGGEMHLVGEMLDDDHSGPIDAATHGLFEAIANSTGRAHTRSEGVGYLQTAGFVDVQVHEFIPGALVRVAGTKPA